MDFDAIPPSSPPRVSNMDPPSPPFFEPRYSAFTSKSSSPPPLFSSDDSRESVDVTNYESPRIHKNKRKGAWWDTRESAPHSPESKKTKFSRNFDSGVYMLSDATDSSEDILPTHKSPFPLPTDTADLEADMDPTGQPSDAMDLTYSPAPSISAAERAFNRQIEEAVEQDSQNHDFNGQNLEDGDIHYIDKLNTVIRGPPVYDDQPPTEGQFRSLEPRHNIYLNQNKLVRLNPSLFRVQFLTQLYLRDNKIAELPQEIGQLVHLETLDVALNPLKHLPFEIVKLLHPHGKLNRLTRNSLLTPMSPSSFNTTDYVQEERTGLWTMDTVPLDLVREDARLQLQHLYAKLSSSTNRDRDVWRIRYFESWANSFDGGEDAIVCDVEEDVGFYAHHPTLQLSDVNDEEKFADKDDIAWIPRYIARTPVSYFDQVGNLLHGSPSLPTSDDKPYSVIIETDRGTYGAPSPTFTPPSMSKVPSLVTMSLQIFLETYTIDEMRAWMSEDFIPRDAEAILSRAEQNSAGGYSVFRECHTCQKKYIVARAEWIEFWSKGMGVFFPAKVAVCSWGCVPRQMVERPQRELSW